MSLPSCAAASEEHTVNEAEKSQLLDKCQALQEERDAAYAEIQTFHGVSHLVLDEVGNMRNQLEIEKTCRESAENYASKVNKENKKLKRISMKFMAKVGIMEFPDNLLDLDDTPLPAEYAETQDLNSDCVSVEKLEKQVSDLREENARLGEQLKECQSKIETLVEQLQNEQAERACLVEKLAEKDATLKKYNRVSTLALEEFTELKEKLNLEQELRQKAENYAHKMMVEKKQAQRQTQVLSNNACPNAVLAQALEDVSTMAARLEEEHKLREKFERDLQAQIDGSALRHELDLLRPRLQVAEEQRCEAAAQTSQAKEQARNLEHKLGILQKRVEELEKSHLLPMPPPPPPPPPPPLPSPLPPHNPLKSLMAMLKGRSAGQTGSPCRNASGPSPKDEFESVRQKAVDEMMQRIKQGVQLRAVTRPQENKSLEKLDGESAVDTLKNLLRSPASQQQPAQAEPASECELSLILRRRREATESLSGQENEGDSRPALGPKSCSLPTLLD